VTPGGAGRRGVVVFACGEPERGDDGVSLAVADRIGRRLGGRAEIRRCGALEPEHLLDLLPDEACVVVDCVAGIAPGEVIVRSLDALVSPDGRSVATPRSTHLLPVADVLALVRVVRPGLPAGSFVGIGGERFGLGSGLSPAVEAALPAVVEVIEAEVDRLAAPGPGG